MKVIDFEAAGSLLRLTKQVDVQRLRKELEEVAEIKNEKITRRERERLLVRKAVSFLPQESRLTLYLKFWEGETLEDIAEILRVSVSTVQINYLAGLSFLERELKPYILESKFFLRADAAT